MAKEGRDGKDTTMTVSRELAKRVRAIADHRDITMPDALDRYAGAAVLREYRKCLAEQQAEVAGGEG